MMPVKEQAVSHGQMVLSTKESTTMARNLGKGSSNGQMAQPTEGNSQRT